MKQVSVLIILLFFFKFNYCQTYLNRADSIISIQPNEVLDTSNGKFKKTEIIVKLTVNHRGEVIQAVPMLKNNVTVSAEIVAASKKYSLKLHFDKRPESTPDQTVFVKLSFATID